MHNIEHIHLETVESTQSFIQAEYPNAQGNILISTDEQTLGRGQYGRKWDSYKGSLSFSATLSPPSPISLTSLEIPLIIGNYFKRFFKTELQLKWPNDIMKDNKKCGGIIINNNGGDKIYFGLGLNLNPYNFENYKTPATSIHEEEFYFSTQHASEDLYQFILRNRIDANDISKLWNERCLHLNKEVTIKDSQSEITGKFIGVGEAGQALIETPLEIKEVFSGSLIKF